MSLVSRHRQQEQLLSVVDHQMDKACRRIEKWAARRRISDAKVVHLLSSMREEDLLVRWQRWCSSG